MNFGNSGGSLFHPARKMMRTLGSCGYRSIPLLVAALAIFASGRVRADVKMPAIFGDHMVLQQEAALPVWGTADAGEQVTVTLGGEKAVASADAEGKWMVKLPPLASGTPPVTMTIAGKNMITFTDVLVGDVWLCSGQSNMEFPLMQSHNGAREIPKAADPQLRLFCFHHQSALQPQFGTTGSNSPGIVFANSMQLPTYSGWVLCNPETARNFTAVGYFFGRELRSNLQRPIGLIESSWGGTRAEVWTSLAGLQKEPVLQHYVDSYRTNVAAYPAIAPSYPERLAAYQADRVKYLNEAIPPFNESMRAWALADQQAKAAGQPSPPQPVRPPAPVEPPDPTGGKIGPANLFNGMIAPLVPYAIKGVIWYQGESNSRDALEYRALFGRMITDWRGYWGQGDFPFLFVQLASYDAGPNDLWAFLREAQFKTLSLPNTAMASAVDLGDFQNPKNIHPMEKYDVGRRLALAAERVAYGQEVVSSGPILDSFKVKGNTITVNFKQTGGGLMIGRPPWIAPKMETSWPTDKLIGFELAGRDGKFVTADAKIEGNSVVVSASALPDPAFVRFGWSNVVWANLYNKEGLPATPFRTDNFLPASPPPASAPSPAASLQGS